VIREHHSFEPGGASRVEVAWDAQGDARIFVDGVLVHRFDDLKRARQGIMCTLEDGSRLSAKLIGSRWELLRDGAPVPDSAFDPVRVGNDAGRLLRAVGGVLIAVALVVEPVRSLFEYRYQRTWSPVVAGALAGALLWIIGRRVAAGRSPMTLLLGLAVYGGDFAWSAHEQRWPWWGVGIYSIVGLALFGQFRRLRRATGYVPGG